MRENRSGRRIEGAIKDIIARLLQRGLKDPRIGFLSIVSVELSGDKKLAKVYVSVYGDEEAKEGSLAGLESAKGFIRSELGKKLRTRHTPELLFILDDSIEHGAHIAKILKDLGTGDEEEGGPRADDDQ